MSKPSLVPNQQQTIPRTGCSPIKTARPVKTYFQTAIFKGVAGGIEQMFWILQLYCSRDVRVRSWRGALCVLTDSHCWSF